MPFGKYLIYHKKCTAALSPGGRRKGEKVERDNIKIKKAIIHILDNALGKEVLSEEELDFGSEITMFFKTHISKVMSEDFRKRCFFYEEESKVYQILSMYQEKEFVEVSKKLAEMLFAIMGSSVDIPPADLAVIRFEYEEEEYLALLKLDYKKFYIHRTMPGENGFSNELVKHKSILPAETQRLSEAAVIRLEDKAIWLTEKKYEINGEKSNYFSEHFLKCGTRMTTLQKLEIVKRILEQTAERCYEQTAQYKEIMRMKYLLHETVSAKGLFGIEDFISEVFKETPDIRLQAYKKLERYGLTKEDIDPKEEKTRKRYIRQQLRTDTGIEVKIPMEQYKSKDNVEFIEHEDGTTDIVIRNIAYIKADL